MVGPGDPAWEVYVDEFSRFLGWQDEPKARVKRTSAS
jgi:hypothetical protein